MKNNIHDYPHPFVTTDAVIFTLKTAPADNYRKLPETELKVLLYKRPVDPEQNKYCIPGGFLDISELPDDNIKRKLSEKSNIDSCYLEQLYTFCDIKRDPRDRVISIAYLGLMPEEISSSLQSQSEWFTITNKDNNLKIFNADIELTKQDFGFDHYNIVKTALERLQSKLLWTDIIFRLMPEEFTLTQLQNAYEVITGETYLVANFRRKISHLVQETGKPVSNKGHRPAMLYIKK